MSNLRYLSNEKGLVLVVSLMLLVTLTVMGLAAISTTSTEIKISGNERLNAQAFQTAEAGIKEVLFRMALPEGQGSIDANQGGSQVTVDGNTFDAYLGDPGWSPIGCLSTPCPNPDWTASIFYTNSEPADPDGNTDYTRTILPTSSWGTLSYATGDTSEPGFALTVRYARESDYNNVSNGDGDSDDLVFYNSTGTVRNPAQDDGVNSDEEFNPPAGLVNDNVIKIITVTGQSGNARKAITVELTGFQLNPDIKGAFTVGSALDLKGNGFISGYNHKQDTTETHENNTAPGDYQTDGCDNRDVKQESDGGVCGLATDPEAGIEASYSQQWEANGHLPGLFYPPSEDPDGESSAEIWGGNDTGTAGWRGTEPGWEFPELQDMMGITQTQLQTILDNANVTEATQDPCPIGVTYIKNEGGQTWSPKCSSGSGLLVVEGDYQAAGQFEFRGLVYIKGHARLRGGSFYLGAVAVKGETTGQKIAGTPTILYSRQTVINQLKSATTKAGLAFTILSWKEG